MSRIGLLVTSLLFALLAGCNLSNAAPQSLAQNSTAEALSCPLIVANALTTAEQNCGGVGLDEVCYGNVRLDATPRDGVTDLQFTQAGDIARLDTINSLRLSSMDEAQNIWGVALMRVRANVPDTLPGQGVTLLMFGDVQITQNEQTNYTPMQAFYFRSGFNDRRCAEAPDSGILIQTPSGAGSISLLVNEVQIQVGSTLYLQAQAGGEMTINTLEGSATATAFGVTQVIPAGSVVSTPLDANGVASGPPSPPQPYDPAQLSTLPLDTGLPETITLVSPLTDEQVVSQTQTPFVPTLSPGALDLGNGYVLDIVETHETDATARTEVQIRRPVLSGGVNTIADPFNQRVGTIVDSRLREFQSGVAQNTPPAELGNVSSSIQITPEMYSPLPNLVSVRFSTSIYMAGAAHPYSVLNTLNYDLVEGRVLELADLFMPRSGYLEILSAYAVEQLKPTFGDALFTDGLAPTEQNYRNWNLTPDGLLINFEQYQAGPGAAGTMQVVVPYDLLRDVMRPDGVLGRFTG